MKRILWSEISAGPLALLCLGLSILAPAVARADIDHTTYIIRTPASDPATLGAIEAAGGVVDHFDGGHARAYILHEHWASFLRAGIPYEIEGMQPDPSKQLDAYPSYIELSAVLADRAATYPEICQLISIGRSVQGRELWAMQITNNPGVDEDEPEFAYLSTLHGDEPVGTVLCLNLIDLLLEGYGHDPALTDLVNTTEIWILPLVNPDGYELGIRWNANNVDLNRAFPQWPSDFSGTIATDGPPDSAGRQAEVARIMEWAASRRLVLSANYHTGALVANYPYDEEPGIPSGSDAPTPDDALIRVLSTEYASRNPPMLASTAFPGGITNGSAWFRISGGMQDWHYRFNGTIDLTLEVSNIKSPGQHTLASLWEDNRDAMIAYLGLAHRGIRGRVTSRSGEPLFATVTLKGNPQPVFTDPAVGDYHRLALPGTYTVRAEAPGYIPYSRSGVAVGTGGAVRADLALSQGDVNGDGRVDALDLQLVINTILGLADIPDADVDGNGVSATDLQHLVNRVLRRP